MWEPQTGLLSKISFQLFSWGKNFDDLQNREQMCSSSTCHCLKNWKSHFPPSRMTRNNIRFWFLESRLAAFTFLKLFNESQNSAELKKKLDDFKFWDLCSKDIYILCNTTCFGSCPVHVWSWSGLGLSICLVALTMQGAAKSTMLWKTLYMSWSVLWHICYMLYVICYMLWKTPYMSLSVLWHILGFPCHRRTVDSPNKSICR